MRSLRKAHFYKLPSTSRSGGVFEYLPASSYLPDCVF